MSAAIAEITVCVDCMIAEQSGETPADATNVPWNLLTTVDANLGRAQDCEHGMADSEFCGECSTGEIDFATTSCAACGTELAGQRFYYTIWAW